MPSRRRVQDRRHDSEASREGGSKRRAISAPVCNGEINCFVGEDEGLADAAID